MCEVLTKKQARRKMIAEIIGRQAFAQKAYEKKMNAIGKKHSAEFHKVLGEISRKAYVSIKELPISIWWELVETGNMLLLLKEEIEASTIEFNALKYIYVQMQDEKLKMFGLPEHAKKLYDLEEQLIELCKERILYDDMTQQTWIDITIIKINDLQKTSMESTTLEELVISLERIMKMPIDIQKCTVAKFYSYIKIAGKNG